MENKEQIKILRNFSIKKYNFKKGDVYNITSFCDDNGFWTNTIAGNISLDDLKIDIDFDFLI